MLNRPDLVVASLDVHIARLIIAIVILLVVLALGAGAPPTRWRYYR